MLSVGKVLSSLGCGTRGVAEERGLSALRLPLPALHRGPSHLGHLPTTEKCQKSLLVSHKFGSPLSQDLTVRLYLETPYGLPISLSHPSRSPEVGNRRVELIPVVKRLCGHKISGPGTVRRLSDVASLSQAPSSPSRVDGGLPAEVNI